jgi:antitoxin component of MazEF toxin-antitoxin module
MAVRVKVAKSGDGFGIHLPAGIGAEIGLIDGSHVDIDVKNSTIILTRSKRRLSVDELLDQATRARANKIDRADLHRAAEDQPVHRRAGD